METIIKKSTKKKEVEKKINSTKESKQKKVFKASKFCGKIKYKKDPMTIQKKLRNEWE